MENTLRMTHTRSTISSNQGFSLMHDHTHMQVFRYVWGLTGGPRMRVEDLTAETYARAWQNRRRFRGDDPVPWLLTIARHLVIDQSRRRSSSETPLEPSDRHDRLALQPEYQAVISSELATLMQAMTHLSPDVRDMVVLRFALEWSVEEIAEHTGKTPNAVYVALHRATASIRALITER